MARRACLDAIRTAFLGGLLAIGGSGEAAGKTAAGPWAAFVLVILARVVMTVQTVSVGALGPALLADQTLDLGYAGLGVLIGVFMLPGIFVALPAGWLTDLLGERWLSLCGLGLLTIGGIVLSISPDFQTALGARLLGGAGAALLNVVLSAMVMARFSGASLAPAMGGFLAAYPFGIGLSMITLPAFASFASSWRGAALTGALGCALVLAAVPFVLRAQPAKSTAGSSPSATQGRRLMLVPKEWGAVLASGVAWAGLNSGFAVLFGFAPALLAERGASVEIAGAMSSLVGWASIPLAPLGGALAERTGRPLLATCGCLAIVAVSVLALAVNVGPQSVALITAGLLVSIAATMIMTLPARALAMERRAVGMGIYWTIFYAGMALLPPVAGWAADNAASAESALWVSASFFAAAVPAVAIYSLLMLRPDRDRRGG